MTITNNTSRTLDAGKLTAYTRPDFVFRDSDTVQRWAQADLRLDAMDVLGSGDTPAIQPGKSADVTISVKPDARAISRITTWGQNLSSYGIPIKKLYRPVPSAPAVIQAAAVQVHAEPAIPATQAVQGRDRWN